MSQMPSSSRLSLADSRRIARGARLQTATASATVMFGVALGIGVAVVGVAGAVVVGVVAVGVDFAASVEPWLDGVEALPEPPQPARSTPPTSAGSSRLRIFELKGILSFGSTSPSHRAREAPIGSADAKQGARGRVNRSRIVALIGHKALARRFSLKALRLASRQCRCLGCFNVVSYCLSLQLAYICDISAKKRGHVMFACAFLATQGR